MLHGALLDLPECRDWETHPTALDRESAGEVYGS